MKVSIGRALCGTRRIDLASRPEDTDRLVLSERKVYDPGAAVLLHGTWLVLLVLLAATAWGDSRSGDVYLLHIQGPIGPATSDYVVRGLKSAQDAGAAAVVLRLDTPGGLDQSMRAINQAVLAATVPTVGYVAPSGARAASAGTYILYTCALAAMAPATTLGAATPVRIGVRKGFDPDARPVGDDGVAPSHPEAGDREAAADPMDRKLVNDAVAYIRALADRRERNADWAERAVRDGATLTASQALELEVIEVMADDLEDLLNAVDGRRVTLANGEVVIHTMDAGVRVLSPGWRHRVLAVIADPNVAYILMLIGVYGLIFELAYPGGVLAGVVGAICLVLALYAFQILPVNFTGLALMMLGVGFMLAEAFVPSFGVLGFGGVVAFVVGSIMLLDESNLRVSLPVVGGSALVSAAFFLWVVNRAVRLRRRKAITGREEMIGASGVALEDIRVTGRVRVHSETWNARASAPVVRGQRVRVTGVDGLTLEIVPIVDSSDFRSEGA